MFANPVDTLRLRRGAEHPHKLGPRAIAEFFCEISDDAREGDDVLDCLDRYRRHLTPALLRQVGGDRFPRGLHEVPR
jgi:hypothetical protein